MTPRFDAIGIAVSNVGASIDFYRLLGLAFPDADGGGHVEFETDGGVRVMLDSEEIMTSFDPSWQPSPARGRVGLAVRCENAAAVDELHALIVAAGHRSHLAPFDAVWGQRYAAVLDPDGTVIDLYAPSG